MKVSVYLEGTLDELAPIFRALQTEKSVSPETRQQATTGEQGEFVTAGAQEKFVTAEFLRQALERHPLSDYTEALLRALYEAGEDGYLSREALRKKIGEYTDHPEFTDQQLTGVIGSFGKRLSQTKGYDGGSHFEDKLVGGERHYRLPDALRDVVRDVLKL